MQEIKINTSKIITVPAGADTVTVQHEWGDVLVTNEAVSGTYSFAPDSVGIHTFIFSNGDVVLTYPTTQDGSPISFNPIISGDIVDRIRYNSVSLYVTQSEFFADNDNLDIGDNSDNFTKTERITRYIINNFTRRNFGPFLNKTKILQGDGGNSLTLPERINILTSCKDTFGNDITEFVEIAPDLNDWVQRKPRDLPFTMRPTGMLYDINIKSDFTRNMREFFPSSFNFILNGNWGWDWVPNSVNEAAKLLISDVYTGATEATNYWQISRKLDDFAEEFSPLAFRADTTGNITADALLVEFININIGLA